MTDLISLGVCVEAGFGGPPLEPANWVDITHDVMSLAPNRGRDGALDPFPAGIGTVVVKNDTAKYDPALGMFESLLDLPGVNGYISTPDTFTLTDDLDIRAKVALVDWTPAADMFLIGQWTTSSALRGWAFQIDTAGKLNFAWSTDGTGGTGANLLSSVATGITDGAAAWVRVTYDRDSGAGSYAVKFWTSTAADPTGSDWVQLGTTRTGTTTAATFATTAPMTIGAYNAGANNPLIGQVYKATVRTTIDGGSSTIVASPDTTFGISSVATSFGDSRQNVWTLNGDAFVQGLGRYKTPRIPIRITAQKSDGTRRGIYFGYVLSKNGWRLSYQMPSMGTVTIICADFLSLLAGVELEPDGNFPSSGLKTIRIFDFKRKQWTFRTVQIDFGPEGLEGEATPLYQGTTTAELLEQIVTDERLPTPEPQGWDIDATSTLTTGYWGDQNGLEWVQMLDATEGGAFYVDRDGQPTFDSRHAVLTDTRLTTAQRTFSDVGGGISYSVDGLERDYPNPIVSSAVISGNSIGDGPQTYENATSRGEYGPTEHSKAELFCEGTDAYARAKFIVDQFSDPIDGIAAISLKCIGSAAQRDAALDCELRDRVNVEFTPPGSAALGADPLDRDHFIERISHRIVANPLSWEVRIGLSPDRFVNFPPFTEYLVFGDATYGTLGTARLAF